MSTFEGFDQAKMQDSLMYLTDCWDWMKTNNVDLLEYVLPFCIRHIYV